MADSTYKVILNWYGELHTFYTNSASPAGALRNAIARLAKELGRSYGSVRCRFNGQRDNFTVERKERSQ